MRPWSVEPPCWGLPGVPAAPAAAAASVEAACPGAAGWAGWVPIFAAGRGAGEEARFWWRCLVLSEACRVDAAGSGA